MARTVSIRLMTCDFGERVIQIRPHWAGQGIAAIACLPHYALPLPAGEVK